MRLAIHLFRPTYKSPLVWGLKYISGVKEGRSRWIHIGPLMICWIDDDYRKKVVDSRKVGV